MTECEITIINKLGLHARAAAKLVECAGKFAARIELGRDEQWVDAKSIMAVMMLAAGQGVSLQLRCDGADEDDARTAIIELINQRFGEPE